MRRGTRSSVVQAAETAIDGWQAVVVTISGMVLYMVALVIFMATMIGTLTDSQ